MPSSPVAHHNPYGHPKMEILDRLQQDHIRTFRTDAEGATSFYLDGSSVSAPRFWRRSNLRGHVPGVPESAFCVWSRRFRYRIRFKASEDWKTS